MTQQGQFIVICGIDGSGKSTQEELLAERLTLRGRSIYRTKNPSDFYRKHPDVRRYLDTGQSTLRVETLAVLSAADRMLQLDLEIVPRLNAGIDVLCNRYVYSSFSYFKARGADATFVTKVNEKARRPDKAILITIDPVETIRRIVSRDGQKVKFEERDPEYLGSVQAEMLRIWPSEYLTVDGARPIQALADEIEQYVTG